jgi:hypothetical protein
VGGQWDVFVQLSGSPDAESTTGTVELRQGETVIGSEKVALAKGSAPRLAFRVGGEQAVTLQARYVPGDFDSLASDNTAWLTLPAVRPISIYVPAPLSAFRHALATLSGVNIFPDDGGGKQAGYDLVISNEEADLQLSARAFCAIGLVPPDLEKLVSLVPGNSRIIDWRRDSPLLQHVGFDDVVLMDSPHRAADATESSFRDLGYEVLADGAHGPVVLEKHDGDTLRVYLLFQPERSTLPYRVGFPVMVSNLVQIALKQAQLAEVAAPSTGVLPPLTLGTDRTMHVEGPANFRTDVKTDARGQLTGVPAMRAGEYVVAGDGGTVRIGVSLLSPMETSLAAVDQIEFNEQLKVTAAAGPLRSDRSLWWGLSAIALGVLVMEWWWFNRRPGQTFAR